VLSPDIEDGQTKAQALREITQRVVRIDYRTTAIAFVHQIKVFISILYVNRSRFWRKAYKDTISETEPIRRRKKWPYKWGTRKGGTRKNWMKWIMFTKKLKHIMKKLSRNETQGFWHNHTWKTRDVECNPSINKSIKYRRFRFTPEGQTKRKWCYTRLVNGRIAKGWGW